MKKFFVVALCFVMIGCTPLEKQAYDVIVGAKAFLDSAKAQHPECTTTARFVAPDGTTHTAIPAIPICGTIRQATFAKDALIDALEIYCSGPQFESGGACQPPAKGTPAFDQAQNKLKDTIADYNQIANDLKGSL